MIEQILFDGTRRWIHTDTAIYRAAFFAHKWLGIFSSAVLAITGLTGALLIWPRAVGVIARVAGPIHERLAIGWIGWWIVVLCTIAAIVIELTGLVIWWKRRIVRVRMTRGWKPFFSDLHHAVGIVTLPMMMLLAVTGVGMSFITPSNYPELRAMIFVAHTTKDLPTLLKLVYLVGTLAFAVQGVTGILMWTSKMKKQGARK